MRTTALVVAVIAVTGCNQVFGVDALDYGDAESQASDVVDAAPGGGGQSASSEGAEASTSVGQGGGAADVATCNQEGGCQACVATYCANDRCPETLDACESDPECTGFRDCYWECAPGDLDCEERCLLAHYAGVEKYNAWMDCKFCAADTCLAACEPAGQCEPYDDCSACLYTEASLDACMSQYLACRDDQACVELSACLYACDADDQACIDGCWNAAPTSVETKHQAFWGCMYCEAAACQSTCAAIWGSC